MVIDPAGELVCLTPWGGAAAAERETGAAGEQARGAGYLVTAPHYGRMCVASQSAMGPSTSEGTTNDFRFA